MDRPIDVRTALSPEEFVRDYIVANRPVIVTDAMTDWPARRWTVEHMKSIFGDSVVEVTDDGAESVATMRFPDFVSHLDMAETENGRDNGSIAHLRYLRSRERGPFKKTRADWSRPYFMPPRWYCLPLTFGVWDPSRKLCPGFNLYISPRGAASKLHVDGMKTNSVLCQIHGSKRCFLIPPDQERLLPDRTARAQRQAKHLSVSRPDFGDATVYEFDVEPGEILFIPNSWFHEVHTTSTSISLSWNFVHGSEAREFYPWYLKALATNRELLNVG